MKTIKLISKKERWGLTFQGYLLMMAFVIAAGFVFVKGIDPFLSAEQTIDAKVMVIEGYLPDYAYPQILELFNSKNYDFIIASGTTYDQGFYLSGLHTAAELIAKSLIELGFDSTKLAVVPVSADIYRDRTYNSALFTRRYLKENHPDIKKINVVSLGPHARRSKYLFQLAMEPDIEVGNIVIQNLAFSSSDWYKSSRGFRGVLNETIAYFYVKLFFWPEKPE